MNNRFAFVLFVFLVILSILSTIEYIYASSSVENTWVTKAPLPQVVNGARAAVVDGKIYVMGGSSNYMYDPVTDTWKPKTPMPNPTMFFAITAYQNRIYVFGGRGDNGTNTFNEVYYPSNDSWEIKQSMPLAASDLDSNVINGKIYLVWNSENEIYDISTNSWSNGTMMPYPVIAYASAVFNNKIYFFGGSSGLTHYGNQTQIYNPVTNDWDLGASIPTKGSESVAIAAEATTGELSLRRIYVLGGWSGDDPLSGSDLNRVYNPLDNSWTFGAPMPTARVGVTVAVVNDMLYAIGGSTVVVSQSTANEQYFPFGYGTPDSLPSVTPTNSPSPSIPEFPFIAVLSLFIIMSLVAALLLRKNIRLKVYY